MVGPSAVEQIRQPIDLKNIIFIENLLLPLEIPPSFELDPFITTLSNNVSKSAKNAVVNPFLYERFVEATA